MDTKKTWDRLYRSHSETLDLPNTEISHTHALLYVRYQTDVPSVLVELSRFQNEATKANALCFYLCLAYTVMS